MSGSMDNLEVEDGEGKKDESFFTGSRIRMIVQLTVVVLVATAFALVCYFGFRDTSTESVDEPQTSTERPTETDVCGLDIISGPCEAAFPRWGYDPLQEECVEFLYGGCEGNENNFMTREICQDACHGEMTDVCELPPEAGPCDQNLDCWYNNEGRCEVFQYGGCEGNGNNFMTEDDCQSRCGDRGGLPATCVQLQDSVYSMKDISELFGTSSLLNDVCPPRRTGDLRDEAALPTGHFASTQINIGPSPMRLFPHSAMMDERGVTYESYTLDRWTDPKRTDEYYQLTPGKDGEPWVKLADVGAGMQQTNSGPDGTPRSTFSGLTGVRVGIEGSGDAVMEDFDIMYANFKYENDAEGSLELPLVRGAAMLTHIFSNANPILTPYCLISINGEEASYECPEEETLADKGSIFMEVSCDNDTSLLSLIVHTTKPIPQLTDIQYAVAPLSEWTTSRQMHTCDSTICSLSEDGMTANIAIPGASGTMAFAVNIINMLVFPQSDYVNWYIENPAEVVCTSNPGTSSTRQSSRMPVWFYGDASISHAQCVGDNVTTEAMVDVTLTVTNPFTTLDEIDYMLVPSDDWTADNKWIPCTPDVCRLINDGHGVVFNLTAPAEVSYFAANVHSQFIIETEPWNWRRQPEEIICQWVPETVQEVSVVDKSFTFELQEPGDLGLTDTRKFVAYFDQSMTVSINDDLLFEFAPEAGGKFTGVMQLVYAGTSPKGDYTMARSMDKYAGVYSYKPKTRFCVEGDVGYISYDWNKVGGDFFGGNPNQDLLVVALPHHEEQLADLIETPWGFKGHVGDTWIIQEDLPSSNMEPDPAAVERIKNNPEQLGNIMAAIEKDVAYEQLVTDCRKEGAQSYWAGKTIAMVARLATISRAFDTDHYEVLDESMRGCLDLWLGIVGGLPEENVFRYDTVWGGLNSRSEKEGVEVFPWTNFGFVSYADHHFHFGLWMYAIAYYAKYHPEWANKEENRVRITAMARDVGNPSKRDVYFPSVRQDWYFGSSWATGIGGGERQEESASEAINCYHALGALGAAMDDPVMESLGRLLTATEIRATRWYWTVRDNNQHIFPEPLLKYGVLGRLQEDGIYAYTLNWECEPDQFPQRHACIVGIQIIPIMSVSHLYMDQVWAENVHDVCSWAIDPPSAPGGDQISLEEASPVTTRFGAFCQMIMSKKDAQSKQDALDYMLALDTADLEPGTGLASSLLFIYEST